MDFRGISGSSQTEYSSLVNIGSEETSNLQRTPEYYSLAEHFIGLGQFDEALDALEKIDIKGDRTAQKLQCHLHLRKGNFSKLTECVEKIDKTNEIPREELEYYNRLLVIGYYYMGNYEEVVNVPRDSEYSTELSSAYLNLGDIQSWGAYNNSWSISTKSIIDKCNMYSQVQSCVKEGRIQKEDVMKNETAKVYMGGNFKLFMDQIELLGETTIKGPIELAFAMKNKEEGKLNEACKLFSNLYNYYIQLCNFPEAGIGYKIPWLERDFSKRLEESPHLPGESLNLEEESPNLTLVLFTEYFGMQYAETLLNRGEILKAKEITESWISPVFCPLDQLFPFNFRWIVLYQKILKAQDLLYQEKLKTLGSRDSLFYFV